MSAYDEMVRPSLARIGAPGDGYATDRDSYWGSGFFVAPGWLLTCAHVVGKGGAAVCRGDSALSVTWQERTAAGAPEPRTGTGTAVVVAPRPAGAQPARDPWPFPDLALVRVTGTDDVRCLWLGDREATPRTPVGLYGWSVQTGELGVRHGTGELAGSDARALLLAGSLPVGGLSGGPVLDLRHGSVIGVIKGRRREEGVAVPVTALYELLDSREAGRTVREVLRAHDLHHASLLGTSSPYPGWTAFQAALPGHPPSGSAVTAELRTRLYGHLAQLPPPAGAGEVVHLVEDVKAQVRGERLPALVLPHVRTWREGAALLYGLRTLDPGGGGTLVDLDAVLLYAARVARRTAREPAADVDAGHLRAFADWIAGQAAGHRHWAVGEAIRALLEGTAGASPPLVPAVNGAVDVPAPVAPVEVPSPVECVAGTPLPTEPARVPLQAAGATVTPPVDTPAPVPDEAPLPVSGEAPPSVSGEVPLPDTRTDVLVRVGPATYGRHPWSVQLVYGGRDVTPVAGDDLGVRAEELAQVLREPLAQALCQGDHGEHLAAIEVFLPRRLFDLPVDDWQLLPDTRLAGEGEADDADDEDDDFLDERSLPLGMRRTVVIREVRRNGLPPSPEWRRRWKAVRCGPLAHGTLHGRPAAEGHPPGAGSGGKYPYYGALSAMSDTSVPVYCGPVGSGEGYAAMQDALRSGHSVVLWRRDRHDHGECGDFHQQAAALLGLAGRADGLHGPVRDLRIRLADPDTARAHGLCGKIAVLFDPPDRSPYGTESMRPPPLAAPGG
ncbi:trypsin-like peptidase domain-containing protein [Streptomyces sp. Go40/10]|uniref:VMAP-C domain-containing protein n=1 Tax=Streptomyces sp. Go40/10 TaxID=2825844 RepID=UPI001E33ABE6|nr:trypsin-like peptidase domain-containing protein [Streptomyces sp. Go40/10]UFR02386.1 trypsin-like peptidase domain-containing protein [Streptomyces sp. Go40/10]